MIGMSVNTFWDRQASSKPRQLRTDAGRSRARLIRPVGVERDPGQRLAARRLGPARVRSRRRGGQPRSGSAAVPASSELADEPDRLGRLAQHHLQPGEHVTASGGDDRDRVLGVRTGRVIARGVDVADRWPGHRADQAEPASLLGGDDAGGLEPVHERVGPQQRVARPAQLPVGAGQPAAQQAGVRSGPARRPG